MSAQGSTFEPEALDELEEILRDWAPSHHRVTILLTYLAERSGEQSSIPSGAVRWGSDALCGLNQLIVSVTDPEAARAAAAAHPMCECRVECLIAFLEGFRALYQIEGSLYLLPYFRETLLLDLATLIWLCARLREWMRLHMAGPRDLITEHGTLSRPVPWQLPSV
ncbi:hypothetical protein ACFV16_38440 [Streptomyces massasporeus]|uniref:hypothetical protein n=1 Tax=Streptomyces massasporeus TaxID=67324 RepID=UPI0036966FC0